MAVIRLIEIEEDTELSNIPYRNGQLIYCRGSHLVYADTADGNRHTTDVIIEVDSLVITDIDQTKIYFNKSDNKLYRYDVNEWIVVNSISEIFDLIADQEDIISGYMTHQNRIFFPVTDSSSVLRQDGDSIENTLIDHEYELRSYISPYERKMVVSADGETIFPIPLPYKSYLVEGNDFSLYKNGKLLVEGIDYTVDIENASVTFVNVIPLNTDLKVIFHYIRTDMDVVQETFIADKNQVEFNLTTTRYLVGKSMTSLYVNGIKQPKEAYTELTPTSFKLNNTVPKGTMVVIEVGKLVPKFSTFYNYFCNKTETYNSDENIKVISIDLDDGHDNVITQILDSKGRVIHETASIDGQQVATQTIKYDGDVVTYTKG